MTRSSLLDALAFQFGWLACVALGNAGALLVATLLLPLHFFLVGASPREWRLSLAIAMAGLAMDLGWQYAGLLQFSGTAVAGVPPWLAVLWLLFAGTLFHSLGWLRQRLALASVLGAVSGPLSYVAGIALGAAESRFETWQVAVAMAPALSPSFSWIRALR